MDKKLYRSRTHRVIAGVCGGLGEYFDLDPVLVRALFVAAALGGGFGVMVYLIVWVVIPEEPQAGIGVVHAKKEPEGEGRNVGAVVLVVLGLLLLFNNFMPHWNFGRLWPVILIAAGVVLLTSRRGE